MPTINTSILDHIVHLTPPGSLKEVTRQFTDLGFKVLPGGVHAGGLTENALVVFEDGVYLELISFTHPRSHYPDGSPEQKQRDDHPWSSKPPGWIDFAFLGNGSHENSISQTINKRARQDGGDEDLYEPEQDGGRTRPDGEVLKWLISGPIGARRGTLPFFCGDVTPRHLRVPGDPPSNTEHPSTALGIAHIRVLVHPSALDATLKEINAVIGHTAVPHSKSAAEIVWELNTPNDTSFAPPRLVLSTSSNADEQAFLAQTSGIYEVGFHVRAVPKDGPSTTPYGRISWEAV